MDALMHRPWWEEEEFARKLGLPARPVRQVLRLLETVSCSSTAPLLAMHMLQATSIITYICSQDFPFNPIQLLWPS